jgi:PAS domain S-box-containing protein
MTFNFSLYSVIFFILGTLVLIITAVIWTRKSSPGALPMAICLTAIAVWIFSRTLQLSSVDSTDKVFWAKVMYFSTVIEVIAWFSFALAFSGSKWHRNKLNIFYLYLLPITSLIIVSMGSWQHLEGLIVKPYLVDGAVLWEHGPLYWIITLYAYTLMAIGFFVLLRFGFRSSRTQLRQILVLLSGTLIASVAIVVNALGYNKTDQHDFIPYLIFVAGLFYTITIFRFKLLDVIPLARNTLVENIPDGILVLNIAGYIADMNPAFEKMLELDKRSLLGKRLIDVCPWLDQAKPGIKPESHTEVIYEDAGSKRYMDVRLIPLEVGSRTKGELLVIRDVSEHRKMEKTLSESDARYRTLVEQSTDGVLIIQDGLFGFANQALSEISGYSITETIGKPLSFMIAEEDRVIVNEIYSMWRSARGDDYHEYRIKRKDGKSRDVEASNSAITFNGHPAYMVTLRDITERKIAQNKHSDNLSGRSQA